ncbi:hypothetical protein SDC9_182275 [bioreactor metagenome]|uniref:Uncharacterized protein n=1 Tax=bioreactor metagenome TaxID=1076179 RepID=A0A645H6Y3_9ZZZZ
MIGHENLSTLGNNQLGRGHAAPGQRLQLRDQRGDIQRHAVSDDICGVGIEHTGGKLMQRKFPIITDDGVSRVGAALKTDDHIGFLRKQVGNFALAFVAPIGAYDCFHHNRFLQ